MEGKTQKLPNSNVYSISSRDSLFDALRGILPICLFISCLRDLPNHGEVQQSCSGIGDSKVGSLLYAVFFEEIVTELMGDGGPCLPVMRSVGRESSV